MISGLSMTIRYNELRLAVSIVLLGVAYLSFAVSSRSSASILSLEAGERSNIVVGITLGTLPWISEGDQTSSDNKPKGIAVEGVQKVFQSMGLESLIKPSTGARLLAQLNNGRMDAALLVSFQGSEIPRRLACTEVLARVPFGVYMAQARAVPVNSQEADHLALGMLRFAYMDLSSVTDKDRLKTFTRSEQQFKSFKAGRLDGVISSPLIVSYWRKRLALDIGPKQHLGVMSIRMCFSNLLGEDAVNLAERFTTYYFSLLDGHSGQLSLSTQQALTMFDGRQPVKALFDY